jgi:phage anti-repressor protein
MNYHATNDFPINLENVFKMIGFANKGNAMVTIKNNFIENEDYKKQLLRTQKLVKNNKSLGGSGLNQETVMLNVDTFKNICMIAKTDKAKEIRKYYIKLENIYNKLINDEHKQHQLELQEKEKLLQQQENELKEKTKIIDILANKPEICGFNDRHPGYVYIIKDESKPGHYKIGHSNNPTKRLESLNISSSTHSLDVVTSFYTFDKDFAERIIHKALKPFKIKNREEWFFAKDKNELMYFIQTSKNCIEYIQKYDIQNLNDITIDENILVEKDDKNDNLTVLEKKQIKNSQNAKLNGQHFKNKTGNYKGVCFSVEKQKWKAELKRNYKINFLGYHDNEIDAAIAYNDYALYLNQNEQTDYTLNEIDNYNPNPRNIIQENKEELKENKSSKYIGVSYKTARNYYVVSIRYNNVCYNLGYDKEEINCAKIYNQQALYFNNHCNTKYKLNDIPDYITVEKNIYKDMYENKNSRKSSKYYGVVFSKQHNKWKALLVKDKKQIHIGFFVNEEEAAKAYNEKAMELNTEKTNKFYKINYFN